MEGFLDDKLLLGFIVVMVKFVQSRFPMVVENENRFYHFLKNGKEVAGLDDSQSRLHTGLQLLLLKEGRIFLMNKTK